MLRADEDLKQSDASIVHLTDKYNREREAHEEVQSQYQQLLDQQRQQAGNRLGVSYKGRWPKRSYLLEYPSFQAQQLFVASLRPHDSYNSAKSVALVAGNGLQCIGV